MWLPKAASAAHVLFLKYLVRGGYLEYIIRLLPVLDGILLNRNGGFHEWQQKVCVLHFEYQKLNPNFGS